MALTSPLAYRAILEPVLTGEAALAANLNELVLSVPAGSTGYLTLKPQDPAGWDLPRALAKGGDSPVVEELTFTASVERDGTYFILVEVERFLVQLTSWGLVATLPSRDGQTESRDVSLESASGAWHTWVLRCDAGRLTLWRDAREVLSSGCTGDLRSFRLGETRTDREHGGRLRLRSLQYRGTLA